MMFKYKVFFGGVQMILVNLTVVLLCKPESNHIKIKY
jgi:hypothetical protein